MCKTSNPMNIGAMSQQHKSGLHQSSTIPKTNSIIKTKSSTMALTIAQKKANKISRLEDVDEQALFFSARHERHNIPQVAKWLKWALNYSFLKRPSDSPQLMEAVLNDQTMVAYQQIRGYESELKLVVPIAVQKVVLSFYAQPAIYPIPFNKPPWNPDNLSWKIHWNESKNNKAHWKNELDQKRLKQFKGNLAEFEFFGRFIKRNQWHTFYC